MTVRIQARVVLAVGVPANVPEPDVEAGVGVHETGGLLGQVDDPVRAAPLEAVLQENHGLRGAGLGLLV